MKQVALGVYERGLVPKHKADACGQSLAVPLKDVTEALTDVIGNAQ